MTSEMANTIEQYVTHGGRVFVEARAGWQDDRGQAQATLPGFGWHKLLGVRESDWKPEKDVRVTWGTRRFVGTGLAEHFEQFDPAARVVARFDDGSPAAFERQHGAGRMMVLGTFAGERNQTDPEPNHPLADVLLEWAGVARPQVTATGFVEVRRLMAPAGELVLLFNHGAQPASVECSLGLRAVPSRIRDLTRAVAVSLTGRAFTAKTVVPPETVLVYRIDY